MYSNGGHPNQRQQRAQSGPLALLLVFAVIVAATTIVVALGAGALTGSQERLGAERAEKTLTQLDSQAALVALGDSNVQTVDIAAAGTGQYVVDDTAGQMTLSYENQTDGTTTTIFSQDLGRISYETSDGSTIAYQGGGVWRSDGDGGSVMVSPPEFHYREATLTLPLVLINSDGTLDNRAVISDRNSTQRFPNESIDGNFTNPLDNARVEVTVTSEYYRAWGEYFETRTDGEVAYDDASNQVTLDLVTPLENTRVTSATASLSASGEFEIRGSSTQLCSSNRRNYTDSYNSSDTPDGYCDQVPGSNGDIVYGGDVDIDGGSGGNDIRGDVVSGNTVFVTNSMGGGQPYVYGNISYSDRCDPSETDCENRITDPNGDASQISGVEEAPAINNIVRTQVDEIEVDNDNGATSGNISSRTLQYTNQNPTDTVELHAGTYYLSDIDVAAGDTVVLNTTEGDITIAVEENVTLADDAEIEVVGDNSTDMYVQGAGDNDRQLNMGRGSGIVNDGDDAPQFQLLGPDNFTAYLGDGGGDFATFTGVIYAPPGSTAAADAGSVTLNNGVIFGGILTGTTRIDNGGSGSIHYDEALQEAQVLERSDSVVRVTYIHASTNNVTVAGG